MSILSGFIKTRKYRKTSDGYKLQSQWTSSQTVEMDDKSTLEVKATDLSNKISDTANSKITYTSNDVADGNATSWTSVTALTSGITHATFAQRVSQMFKNVRYLYKMLGTTDISAIGDGTVTGGLSSLNSNFTVKEYAIGSARFYKYGRAVYLTVVGGEYSSNGSSTEGFINIPVECIPVQNCEMYDANTNHRVVASTKGIIYSPNIFSGNNLRFSGYWLSEN